VLILIVPWWRHMGHAFIKPPPYFDAIKIYFCCMKVGF
jgi:hypothetical protein